MIPVSRPCIGEEESKAVADVMSSGQLTMDRYVMHFETRFRQYHNTADAIAVSSGTAALHLALAALNIGPGDEVLVPDLSFVATANAVRYVGATPVLCDINATWGIDPLDAERKVTPRTKAMIPVHLYGNPCDLGALQDVCERYQLYMIEDAAEGLGGKYGAHPLGTLGIMGCFSFYGNKVITTGEGGMVVTNEPTLAERLRYLRGQAVDQERRYYHAELGFNFRMTEMQAAIGWAQMPRIEEFLLARGRVCEQYARRLGVRGLIKGAAPWLFTTLLPRVGMVKGLMGVLAKNEIDSRPCFVPMHRLPMYKAPEPLFKVSTEVADRAISLPTYPDLKSDDVDRICDLVLAYLKTFAGGAR